MIADRERDQAATRIMLHGYPMLKITKGGALSRRQPACVSRGRILLAIRGRFDGIGCEMQLTDDRHCQFFVLQVLHLRLQVFRVAGRCAGRIERKQFVAWSVYFQVRFWFVNRLHQQGRDSYSSNDAQGA